MDNMIANTNTNIIIQKKNFSSLIIHMHTFPIFAISNNFAQIAAKNALSGFFSCICKKLLLPQWQHLPS